MTSTGTRTGRLAALVACVAALIAPALVGPPVHAALPADLVLLYRFDTHSGASVPDSSASGLTGTLLNADPASAYVAGPPGYAQALRLVGEQRQYVDVPDRAPLDVDRFTLAALVRYTGVQNSWTNGRWEVLEKNGAYWINIRTDGRVRVGGFFGGCGSSRYWKYLDSTATVPTNTWTHVASTYDGARLRVYVDGAPSGSLAVTGRTCSNAFPLAVGAKNVPGTTVEAFFDGQVDAVRIYRRALTASAVDALAP